MSCTTASSLNQMNWWYITIVRSQKQGLESPRRRSFCPRKKPFLISKPFICCHWMKRSSPRHGSSWPGGEMWKSIISEICIFNQPSRNPDNCDSWQNLLRLPAMLFLLSSFSSKSWVRASHYDSRSFLLEKVQTSVNGLLGDPRVPCCRYRCFHQPRI